MATTPRGYRRASLAPLANAAKEREAQVTRRVQQVVWGATDARVRLMTTETMGDGTCAFVLHKDALGEPHRAAIEAAVAAELGAPWSCAEETRALPGDTGPHTLTEPQQTLVIRLNAAERTLARPVWKTALYYVVGALGQCLCAYALYWLYAYARKPGMY